MNCPLPVPAARDPFDIAGGLAAGAAAALGLPAGTPVTVGSYDSYIDLARMGANQHGDACILLGSTLVVGQVTNAATVLPPDGALRATAHLGEGQLVGGWTSAAGLALDWCSGLFGGDIPNVWADSADLRPGQGGLLVLPYLAGERAPVWDALARGVIVGLTARTSRLEICRAVLDGVALSTRDLTQRIGELLPRPARWRTGGGGVRNPAWLQATCDAVGTPFEVVEEPSGAAAAAHGFAAVTGVPMAPPVLRSVVPDVARSDRYSNLYQRYRELYPRLADIMHALAHIGDDRRGDC
jgi:xylulokinase